MNASLAAILAGSRVFSDETPMPVLDPGRGRTKRGQFWSHAVDDRPWGGPAPPAVAYDELARLRPPTRVPR